MKLAASVVVVLAAWTSPALANPRCFINIDTDCPHKRPVFFDAGVIGRQFAIPEATMTAFRAANPGTGSTDTSLQSPGPGDSSITGDFRFGARFWDRILLGGEAEFGRMATVGSNVAGAYAIVGIQGAIGIVRLEGELVAGPRWVRYFLADTDKTRFVVEPRVRAEVWVASQLTFGVAAGTTIGDPSVRMAELYVGVHSVDFGGD